MNLTDIQLALRSQALTLSVATTGSTTLSATNTGYARASGSFVTDGFLPGMEVVPSGFGANTPQLIRAVAALSLTTVNALAAESASAGRTLAVTMPALRAYDNQRVATLTDRWAVEEDFLVQPMRLRTLAGSSGTAHRTGLYLLRVYVPIGYGMAAGRRFVDDLLALFAMESSLAVAGGDSVRVRGDVGPSAGSFLPLAPSWSVITVTIPWYILSLNS